MARRKIREFDAKRIITQQLKHSAPNCNISWKAALITPETNLNSLIKEHSWLTNTQLVIKPDQLFGKRAKYGLVLVNANWQQVLTYLEKYQNQPFKINNITDNLTHFIIEPFVPHKEEFYLSFTSERNNDLIYFYDQGGYEIEDRWDKVTKIEVPTQAKEINWPTQITQKHPTLIPFMNSLFQIYRDLDFTYLELNPFTITKNNTNNTTISLLDCVANVDDYAIFKQEKMWNIPVFPREFGKKLYPQEEYIEQIDQNSGASLKLTVLNPKGKIWNILGGGGASIIYLDMISNLGKGNDIGNYGESSGNPTTNEFYEYTKTILDCMLQDSTKGKILFIVGGIANFTDVAKTFAGAIKALEEYHQKLKEAQIHICVRRGGPNYEVGLAQIEKVAKRLGLSIEVYGPSTPMPAVIQTGVKALR
ncbi:ATPase [Candidatus Woesearchaeota archaeon]|nr:ATPase [Candidatus Woesearchaeota archaeon]